MPSGDPDVDIVPTKDQQEWMELLTKITEDVSPLTAESEEASKQQADPQPYKFDESVVEYDRHQHEPGFRRPAAPIHEPVHTGARPRLTFDESQFEDDYAQESFQDAQFFDEDAELLAEEKDKSENGKVFKKYAVGGHEVLDKNELEDDISSLDEEKELDLLAQIVEQEIDDEIEREINEEIIATMNRTEDGKRFIKFFQGREVPVSSVLTQPTVYEDLIQEFAESEERIKRKALRQPGDMGRSVNDTAEKMKLHLLPSVNMSRDYFNDSKAR